jgi:8-oxo-(d)GTP phosphatase
VSSSAAATTVPELGRPAAEAGSSADSGDPEAGSQTAADIVLAAGAVLWRRGPDGGPEVALVHRPKYDDWSLPKGKLLPQEHPVAAAVREVREETGFGAVLGLPLPTQHYLALGRPKQVDYWAARALGGDFTPSHEVDQLMWTPAGEAPARLTHPRDGDLVARFAATPTDTWLIIVLRHAEAVERDSWAGDDLERPLNEQGYEQTERLRPLLAAYGVRRVVTSPARRCRDSVLPYAEEAGLAVEEVDSIYESNYKSDGHAAYQLTESLLAASERVVVCTHRPVLPGLVSMLCAAAEGATRPPQNELAAGAFWVLHLSGRRVVAVEEHTPEPPGP